MTDWAINIVDEEWTRTIGRFKLRVWKQGGGFPWQVEFGDNVMLAIGRRKVDCETLEIAKAKAESAAWKLLTDALASLNVKRDPDPDICHAHRVSWDEQQAEMDDECLDCGQPRRGHGTGKKLLKVPKSGT